VRQESTWYCSHYSPIIPAPEDRWWWMWSNRWNANWQGKPKYSEKICPCANLSITNPSGLDPGSNPGRHGGKPKTNRLSYDTAIRKSFRDFSNANGPEGSAGSTNKSGWKLGDGFLLYMGNVMKYSRFTYDEWKSSVMSYSESTWHCHGEWCHRLFQLTPLQTATLRQDNLLNFQEVCELRVCHVVEKPLWKYTSMKIYDMSSILNQSLPNSLTPKNTKSGFLRTRIWLFNTDVLTEYNFLLSTVLSVHLRTTKILTIMDSQFLTLQTPIYMLADSLQHQA
jgi:hypothetical protein